MTREVAGTSRCYFPQDVATPQLDDFENPSVNAAEVAEYRRIHRSNPTSYPRSQCPQRLRTERPYRRRTSDYVERRTYAYDMPTCRNTSKGSDNFAQLPWATIVV
ncbi:hypothetical protein HPB52_010868 [Rhipicephalus sanguineus]|uniref:Uncharacterized protein n=1 Tax=Rhipicephalus sanguineus TaxID=34632 RepID=A0A9D4Q6B7_RHISA|nr:hypothetical protein HPB52_010868 [Rhipicephalus sanguineus]